MAYKSDSTFVWKPGKVESDEDLMKILMRLKKKGIEKGMAEDEIKAIIESQVGDLLPKDNCGTILFSPKLISSWTISILILFIAIVLNVRNIRYHRCLVENNYIVMEITRPETECSICKGVTSFKIMENVSKEEFSKYAYLGRPMLVRAGCKDWSALKVFTFDFFKELYNDTKGAFQSVEEECQFFPFKTEFLRLQEVFNMPASRAKMLTPEEKTWYIGWSNCNPDISKVLRQHYTRPYFLPDDSELSAIDWIFMGYSGQGASMHLDYVQRPSWQAQITGSKSWYLRPPPECEAFCHSMNITVKKGDIILIDTNQWYHTTFIEGTEMSITLGSEYD